MQIRGGQSEVIRRAAVAPQPAAAAARPPQINTRIDCGGSNVSWLLYIS